MIYKPFLIPPLGVLSYTLAVNESARYKKFATDVRDTIAKEPFNYVMKATESVSLCLHIILSYHSNLIMIVNHTAEIQLPCSPPPPQYHPSIQCFPSPYPPRGDCTIFAHYYHLPRCLSLHRTCTMQCTCTRTVYRTCWMRILLLTRETVQVKITRFIKNLISQKSLDHNVAGLYTWVNQSF